MNIPIEPIKYGLYIIILLVISFKVFKETTKIVKKFKKNDLDFQEELA